MKVAKKGFWVLFTFLALLPIHTFATDITFTSSGSIVEGDVFGTVNVQNDGTVVDMSGGQITEQLNIRNDSTFDMLTGSVSGNIWLYPLSNLNISNGILNVSNFIVYSNVILNISGGDIAAGILKTYPGYPISSIPASAVIINGGILNFDMFDINGTLDIYRGILNVDDFNGGGQINIYGSEFNYNPATQILNGRLLDNNLFTIKGVDSTEYARFNLIPEPISIVLFGFGLLALHKRK